MTLTVKRICCINLWDVVSMRHEQEQMLDRLKRNWLETHRHIRLSIEKQKLYTIILLH